MAEKEWDVIVRGNDHHFHIPIKEILKCKDLIMLLVKRNFIANYKQTVLGPAWAIIQPFFTTVVYSIFFGNIAGLGAENVPNFIFYLSGTIVWHLFSQVLIKTSGTFVNNTNILGKVYFPRMVMPITTMLSEFISFAIQFVFLICFLLYYLMTTTNIFPNWFIILTPILVLQVAVLGLGCGIIISALTTKYRDLTMLVGFGVSLWSYASPVAYDMFSRAALMPGGRFYDLYMLNPITPIINVFRYAYFGCGNIDWMYYGISWISTIIVLIIGINLFNRVEKTFMDTV